MALDDALRFDPAVYAQAQRRVETAPLSLTTEDFEQLRIVSPHLEREARAAQHQASLAVVEATAEPPAPRVTKSAAPVTPPKDQAEFLARYGQSKVTYAALFEATDLFIDALKTQVLPRVKTLEQANADLSARVLELEARVASRELVP